MAEKIAVSPILLICGYLLEIKNLPLMRQILSSVHEITDGVEFIGSVTADLFSSVAVQQILL